jgi:hypothetical protein
LLQRGEQLLRGSGSTILDIAIDGTLGRHGGLELGHRL